MNLRNSLSASAAGIAVSIAPGCSGAQRAPECQTAISDADIVAKYVDIVVRTAKLRPDRTTVLSDNPRREYEENLCNGKWVPRIRQQADVLNKQCSFEDEGAKAIRIKLDRLIEQINNAPGCK